MGLSAPTGDCTAGYYCTQGASVSTPTDGVTGDECLMGGYCLQGSNATTLCPPGTYNPTRGNKQYIELSLQEETVVAMIVWQLDLQLPVQAVSITTNVVSMNPRRGVLDTTLCD